MNDHSDADMSDKSPLHAVQRFLWMENGGGSTCFACAEDVALMGNPHPASKTRKRVLKE